MTYAPKILALFVLVAGVAAAQPPATPAPAEAPGKSAEAKGPRDALESGGFTLGLRYRLESVADDDPRFRGRDALASTLRTELGYQSRRWRGLEVVLRVEDVTAVGGESYDNAGVGSLANRRRDRPAIADPDATPAGLEDLSFAVSGRAGKVSWLAAWHRFAADSGIADYGRELDLELTYPTSWKQVLGVKAAIYDTDTFAADTTKLMVWTSWGL